MKKQTQILSVVLALAMLASCAKAPSGNSSQAPISSQGITQSGTDDREYVNGTIDVTDMPEKTLENKKITIYCWGEYVPERLHDWQGFRFIDYYGGEVEMIISSGDYYENLYKLVAAGDIPDIVIGEGKSFPNMIMRDLVQPWDDYLDYANPVWEQTGSKSCIDEMKWDNKIYNLTAKSHTLGVMFYNKRLVEEAALEDPAELQQRGEWTWESFRKYIDETTVDTNGDGVTDVYGLVNTGDFPIALFSSTGENHIDYKENAFINNVKSAKIQDAANFLYDIGNNGAKLMSLGDPVSEFLNGKAAFVYTNDYRGYEDYSTLWSTDGIGVVPMPAYKQGEEQFQAALNDNIWLMKGAKNPEGAALMVLAEQYDRLLNMDPVAGTPEKTDVNRLTSKGFSPEAAQAVAQINKMPTKVVWSRCVTLKDGSLEYRAMDEPWITLADSASGSIDKAIQDTVTPIS